MKRNYLIVLCSIILISSLFGCSSNTEQFNTDYIIFRIVDSQLTDEADFYEIEITNKTGFDLSHLSFNLSYPIKQSNGSKSNPFVIEGKTDNGMTLIHLNAGETITFSIHAPIQEVFSNTNLLDFENPSVELKGLIKKGKEEIPFGLSGGLRVIINS